MGTMKFKPQIKGRSVQKGGVNKAGAKAGAVKKKGRSYKDRIRGLERLLKKEDLDPRARKAKAAELEELKAAQQQHQRAEKERKLAQRYHRVKFFERVKIERQLQKLLRKAKDQQPTAAEEQLIKSLQDDLLYIKHYPKDQKYVSLLRTASTPEDQQRLEESRAKMRALIKARLAEVALVTEADEGMGSKKEREEGGGAVAGDTAGAGHEDSEVDDFFLDDTPAQVQDIQDKSGTGALPEKQTAGPVSAAGAKRAPNRHEVAREQGGTSSSDQDVDEDSDLSEDGEEEEEEEKEQEGNKLEGVRKKRRIDTTKTGTRHPTSTPVERIPKAAAMIPGPEAAVKLQCKQLISDADSGEGSDASDDGGSEGSEEGLSSDVDLGMLTSDDEEDSDGLGQQRGGLASRVGHRLRAEQIGASSGEEWEEDDDVLDDRGDGSDSDEDEGNVSSDEDEPVIRDGSVPGRKGSLPGKNGSLPGRNGSFPGKNGSLPGRNGSLPGMTSNHNQFKQTRDHKSIQHRKQDDGGRRPFGDSGRGGSKPGKFTQEQRDGKAPPGPPHRKAFTARDEQQERAAGDTKVSDGKGWGQKRAHQPGEDRFSGAHVKPGLGGGVRDGKPSDQRNHAAGQRAQKQDGRKKGKGKVEKQPLRKRAEGGRKRRKKR